MNFLLQLFIYVVLAIASSILSSAEAQQQKQTPGTRGSRQEGGDNSLAIVVGKTGLGGQFEYWADWGKDGETPNAFHSEVYSLGDKPYNGFTGFFFNGARGTLRYDQPHPELGIPVEEARRDGKDHLWVKFYDGRQTGADAMLVARTVGQERPWTADMIFRGCPYVVVTALSNREIFTGFPTYLFEVEGIDLYDMSLDSSVGGDGPQRLDDPSTWAYSNDPMVAASNIFFGIRYEGEWLYGAQKITAYQLPADNWIAQIRKSKARGFTCGYEIVCGEVEPHAVIGEFLMAAAARIAEIGGLYKVLVGEPDAPVRSFTDDDIFITEEQELDPFPGLEVTCNVITSTYPEPAEAWGMKPAPSRYSSVLEAEDDGRRLPKPVAYKAVYDALQVQQLDKMAVEEARRFRTHINVMPPAWWEAEPLDAELWTSARNGYVNKTMLIIAIDDQPNADQLVARREVEPSDYSWSGDMELPWEASPLGTARPVPQEVSGFYVEPIPGVIGYDAYWSEASVAVDVEFVRISHRLPGEAKPRWTGMVPKPDLLTGSGRILQALQRAQTVEVQIEYVPYSGRATVASDWMLVTTADIRIGPSDLTKELNDARAQATRTIEEMQADRSRAIAQMANALGDRVVDMQTMRTHISARFEETTAAYTHEVTVIAGAMGSLADRTETLGAQVNDPATGLGATAEALDTLRVSVTDDLQATAESITTLEVKAGDATGGFLLAARVTAAPVGWDGAIQFGLRGSEGGAPTWVGLMIVRKNDGTGRIYLDADETIVTGKMRSTSGLSFIDWNTGAQRMGG